MGDAGGVGGVALGYGMGIVIYITMLIYGQTVMQGVLEEKQSRVLEVMASSVRPFDLLMGKVLGIGAMGLVQLLMWAVIIAGLAAGYDWWQQTYGPRQQVLENGARIVVPAGPGGHFHLEAVLNGTQAAMTVRFVSDQIAETLDKTGKPVSGTDAVT